MKINDRVITLDGIGVIKDIQYTNQNGDIKHVVNTLNIKDKHTILNLISIGIYYNQLPKKYCQELFPDNILYYRKNEVNLYKI